MRAGICQLVGRGAISSAIAIIWLTVLSLPQKLAPAIAVLPVKLGVTRQPATLNSRAKIKNTPQAGSCLSSIRANIGANTNNLSTRGSRNLPNSVIELSFRAK